MDPYSMITLDRAQRTTCTARDQTGVHHKQTEVHHNSDTIPLALFKAVLKIINYSLFSLFFIWDLLGGAQG